MIMIVKSMAVDSFNGNKTHAEIECCNDLKQQMKSFEVQNRIYLELYQRISQ